MRLVEAVGEFPGKPVVPLMGYPGIAATGHSVTEVLTSLEPHLESLSFLEERYHPACLFHVMDLTVEAEAAGLPLRFGEAGPPSVAAHPVDSLEALSRLDTPDPALDGRMPLFRDVVGRMASTVRNMTGAYCVGPFTLAAELAGAEELAMRTITDPDFALAVVEFASRISEEYASALAAAGADVVAILEPTAVILSPASFEKLCLEPLARVARAIRGAGAFPVLHICGDSLHLVGLMVRTGVDGLSLDHPVDLEKALDIAPADVAVIGNVDPVGVMVEGSAGDVLDAARALVDRLGKRPNFLLGTGCDLPIDTPLANLDALFDLAR